MKASTWNFHVPHNATLQEILAIVQWWCDRQHPSIQLRQLALVLCNGSEACGCEVAIGVGKMPRDHSTCIHLPSHIPCQAGWSLNSCRKRWGWWEDINDLSPFAFGFPGFTLWDQVKASIATWETGQVMHFYYSSNTWTVGIPVGINNVPEPLGHWAARRVSTSFPST